MERAGAQGDAEAVAPGVGLRVYARVAPERAWHSRSPEFLLSP